jgi:hypothetical protein
MWTSNWRSTLRNYLPDVDLTAPISNGQDQFDDLLGEIKLNEGKEDEGIRSYLRRNRTDAYVLVPELSVMPASSLLERVREVAHILRPVMYTTLVAVSISRGDKAKKLRWAAWALSLAMDTFAEWPQITSVITGKELVDRASPIEKDERQIRLIKFLLYLLRDPLYTMASKKYIDSVSETLSGWRLLRPFIGNTMISPSLSYLFIRNGKIISKTMRKSVLLHFGIIRKMKLFFEDDEFIKKKTQIIYCYPV